MTPPRGLSAPKVPKLKDQKLSKRSFALKLLSRALWASNKFQIVDKTYAAVDLDTPGSPNGVKRLQAFIFIRCIIQTLFLLQHTIVGFLNSARDRVRPLLLGFLFWATLEPAADVPPSTNCYIYLYTSVMNE